MEKSVYEFDEALDERRELSFGRIKEIPSEVNVPEPFMQYFREVAEFILDPSYDIALPEKYEVCWSNPRYAVLMLGEKLGRLLCYLSYELMGIIPFRAEGLKLDEVILMEVFIQVYGAFEAASLDGTLPDEKEIKGILYSFVSDYMDHTVYERIKGSVEGDNDFALRIIQDSDLSDLSYLEKYGEYVSDNTIGTAKYLNSLSDEKIELMAAAFTNGYITGFANTGKDIKKKKTVNLRYHIGFERLVRAEIRLFKEAGLSPVIYRRALHVAVRGSNYVGYYGDRVNPQMDYDHREDKALFMDKAYVNRKLEVSRFAYEQVKDKARVMGGPAVMETFGEKPFKPEQKSEAPVMSEKQRRLDVELTSKLGSMVNEYIPGDERSFSIIAYPVPEIGDDYEKIFTETVKLNTLDCKLYEDIQQKIITELEKGNRVRVKGKGKNKTDITVVLHELKDKTKETVFENCVADVNIPVGEVFTSPALEGTNGTLFVSEVFINGLRFENLEISVKDGFTSSYTCTNFEDEEKNKKYIADNILFNHESLTVGEFAIGTNTTAYAMAKKYGIFSKLPILIAEKTGPHFAFGDTCYSREEDIAVFNPDGREIISRDNEYTIRRKTDEDYRYFECHTDITIPYEELGCITSVDSEGNQYDIIRDGLFVLEGCEALNLPLNID